ncbi:FtsX-like permease family protein [Actinocatenispora sera]|uniref:ABC3 transporter permease C-terminal domain-containing protein n=1 Tax=Actinocatenispora sera TaxID=390989 RepID=A0A810L7J8_9ACTN|nr:FtsX-like permease family protein [Actinocatenispora sera]BCJ31283.1 hypothetical protein Asera_53910 [Actinocatenispora sera]
MHTFRLALAGLRYRGARSVVVGLIAAVAVAAAVIGPASARAAEQSILLDRLRAEPSWLTGFTVGSIGTAGDESPAVVTGGSGPSPSSDALARIPVGYLTRHAARTMQAQHYYAAPIGGVVTAVALPRISGDRTTGRLVYRHGFCHHLTITSGHCPTATGEVLVSSRSPYRTGQRIPVTASGVSSADAGTPGTTTVRVAGRYRAPGGAADYWFGHGYFDAAVYMDEQEEVRRIDSFFGTEATVRSIGVGQFQNVADFRLLVERVRLDDVATLQARLAAGATRIEAAGLRATTPLPGVLSDVDRERDQVVTAALLVAVQLVLLCWFVLFGVVRAAIDERVPELALAKLRGLPSRGVTGFGLAEIGVLVLAAVPVGILLGLAGSELYARFGLAAGAHAQLRWPVLAAAAGAFAGAFVAAALAARRTVATPVIELLRRVPPRSGRLRAGIAEGALVAIAVAACYELLTGAGGRLGLLAGGLVAVVAGILAGRLVPLAMRRGVARARRRGRIGALLAAARVARRGQVPRTVALTTVAVALLCYGAVVWDVAGRNQAQRAGAEMGAPTVYSVQVASAQLLRDAVRQADPSGHQAMAVARGLYGNGAKTTEVLAVDSSRFADVAYWQSSFAADSPARLAGLLRPPAPPMLTARDGALGVGLRVRAISRDVTLVALLSDDRRGQHVVRLGGLHTGRYRLTGRLNGCGSGCRVVGFDLYRGPDAPARIRGDLTVTTLTGAGRELAPMNRPGSWRGVEPTMHQPVSTVAVGSGGTSVRFDAPGGEDLRVLRVDAPNPLPAVSTGRIDRQLGRSTGPGLYGLDQPYRVVARARTVPAIRNGLLVDLTYADRSAPDGSSLDTPMVYQVWAAAGAPASLRSRLTAAGLTITGTDTLAAHQARLARQGPALALRLYLVAAFVALLLAAAAVLVTAHLTARPLRYELAALRVVGLSRRLLRRAGWREYGLLLGTAVLAGAVAGGIGAALAVPRLPQVTANGGPPPLWLPGAWWPGGALAASVLLLGFAAAVAVGAAVRGGRPERLREGST